MDFCKLAQFLLLEDILHPAQSPINKEILNDRHDENALQGKLWIKIIEARNLVIADITGASDPYAVLTLNNSKASPQKNKSVHSLHSVLTPRNCSHHKIRTKTKKKTLDPIWNEEFTFEICDEIHLNSLKIEVYDEDALKTDDFLGYCILHFVNEEKIKPNEVYDDWITLRPRRWREKVTGQIHIQYKWMSERASASKGVNFSHILNDTYTMQYFYNFLEMDYSEENLNFYLHVEQYKQFINSLFASSMHKLMQSRKSLIASAPAFSSLLSENTENKATIFLLPSLQRAISRNIDGEDAKYEEAFLVAKEIYETYLQPGAKHEVNLDYESKEFFIDFFDHKEKKLSEEEILQQKIKSFRETCPTLELLRSFFDIPQVICFNIVETDCYPRFVKSTFFKRLIQSIEWTKRFISFEVTQKNEALNRLVTVLNESEFASLKELIRKRDGEPLIQETQGTPIPSTRAEVEIVPERPSEVGSPTTAANDGKSEGKLKASPTSETKQVEKPVTILMDFATPPIEVTPMTPVPQPESQTLGGEVAKRVRRLTSFFESVAVTEQQKAQALIGRKSPSVSPRVSPSASPRASPRN